MAEDPPSREILEQLLERLDVLERVLQAHTARLHLMERRLGIAFKQQPLQEPLAAKTHPSTTQVKAPESKGSEANKPAPHAPDPPEQTWSRPETRPPRTTETHPWMNEASNLGDSGASRTYAPRAAAAPSPLR